MGDGRATQISAIVCAYTLDRWSLLVRSVGSSTTQTTPPLEIIVCVDHNDESLQLALGSDALRGDASVPVTVVANRYDGRLGSARTTAAERARGDILVFLDDDASAAPDLLERLSVPYADPSVVAVGGAPMPEYSRPRPAWFPPEFDWVFGCVYAGLPTSRAPTLRLIGAVMLGLEGSPPSEWGTSIPTTTMTWTCVTGSRTAGRSGKDLFEPAATARHYVHPERLTWSYFWRRCFVVNRGKVVAQRDLPGHDGRSADRRFVATALSNGLRREFLMVRAR